MQPIGFSTLLRIALTAFFIFMTGRSHATSTISSKLTEPISTVDPFDVSQGTVVLANTKIFQSYSAESAFGYSAPSAPQPTITYFADEGSVGKRDSITIKTRTPVTISGFNLHTNDDTYSGGAGPFRGISEIAMYSSIDGVSWTLVESTGIATDYTKNYGAAGIQLLARFKTISAQYFKFELKRSSKFGPRILEIDAVIGPSLSLSLGAISPQLAPDLDLNHFIENENLSFPVTVANEGDDAYLGSFVVSIYLSTSKSKAQTVGEVLIRKQFDNSSVPARGRLDLFIIQAVDIAAQLRKGRQYYFVVEISATPPFTLPLKIGGDTTASAKTYSYAGVFPSFNPTNTPETFLRKYYTTLRDAFNGKNPFVSQGVNVTPNSGERFTAAFECTGGYDRPVLYPYIDTVGVPTIGIGINLKAITTHTSAYEELVNSVKSFYANRVLAGDTRYQDLGTMDQSAVRQLLITQASLGKRTAFTKTDAQRVFNLRYADSTNKLKRTFGSSWDSVPDKIKWVLTDIDFNAGLFPSVNQSVIQENYLIATYDFLLKRRTGQVGTDRTLAGVQFLLDGDVALLGKLKQ